MTDQHQHLTIAITEEEEIILRTLAHRLQTTPAGILEAFIADLVHSSRSMDSDAESLITKWLDHRTGHFAPGMTTAPVETLERLSLTSPDDLDEALLGWAEVVYNEWERRTELTFDDVGGIWRVWFDGEQWVIGPPDSDPIPASSARLRTVLHHAVEMMRHRNEGAL